MMVTRAPQNACVGVFVRRSERTLLGVGPGACGGLSLSEKQPGPLFGGWPMSRKLIYAVLVCTSGLAVGAGSEQPRSIPLESVYSTSEQMGLKRVTDSKIADGGRSVYVEPYGRFLEKIRREFHSGPTNV